ncbi:hypothetical protein GCM10012282_64000 [Streptomyces lacrimifluminis]|uniref:Uncharacterized protein n=1 Tax=Streptomyces lacrimifluminis TaxID=1500077 RepID=A0A917LEF4_9ACTN|nr:hypothetical protein GCM10012282_64000 [Streptomyces lacrimifluminis]
MVRIPAGAGSASSMSTVSTVTRLVSSGFRCPAPLRALTYQDARQAALSRAKAASGDSPWWPPPARRPFQGVQPWFSGSPERLATLLNGR